MNGVIEPPLPADTNLRDFDWMPLEVRRLLKSDWWILACLEEPQAALAAVHLWAEAWHQVPAASLPQNDAILMCLARVDAATWSRIKERVMQPWRLASDGRFYHLVLVEKAIDARQRQAEAALRREKTREKLRAFREKSVTVTERLRNPPDAESGNGYVTPLKRTGTGTEKRKKEPPISPPEGGDAESAKGQHYPAAFLAWWDAYPRKVGKLAALRAWERAWARVGGPAPHQTLQAACVAFAAASSGGDPQYLPHPSTWLNQGRWEDPEPMPAKAGPPRGGVVPLGVGG
jgi:hypothetical protein